MKCRKLGRLDLPSPSHAPWQGPARLVTNPILCRSLSLDLTTRIEQMLDLVTRVQCRNATSKMSSEISLAICDGVITLSKKLASAQAALRAICTSDGLFARLVSLISPLADGSTSERTRRAEGAESLGFALQSLHRHLQQHAEEKNDVVESRLEGCTTLMQEQLSSARAIERDRTIRAILERTKLR